MTVDKLKVLNFEVLRSFARTKELTRELALRLVDVAEEGYKAAARMIEYAAFLERLIHDLREEKGLPQMPGKEEWPEWIQTIAGTVRWQVRGALKRLGVHSFEQLCALTEQDLMEQRYFGKSSLHWLKKSMAAKGLRLRGDLQPRSGCV